MAPAPQGTILLQPGEGPGSTFRGCWCCSSVSGWGLAGGCRPLRRGWEGLSAHMGLPRNFKRKLNNLTLNDSVPNAGAVRTAGFLLDFIAAWKV